MRVLITGASKGLGQALANEFAKNGFDLVICARSADLLQENANRFEKKYKVDVHCIPIDLAQKQAAAKLIKQIEKAGLNIDALVNNVGIGYHGFFVDMPEDKLYAVMQLNMEVLTQLTHYFGQTFKEKKQGYILQVGSIAGFMPGPKMALYYATKAYVLNLSKALFYELKNNGVQISVLCPGPTRTHFFQQAGMENTSLSQGMLGMHSAEYVAQYAYRHLMKGKRVIIPGFVNKLLAHAVRFTPTFIINRVINNLHQKMQR